MAIAGFAFDVDRAHTLADILVKEELAAAERLAHAVGRPVKALSVKDLNAAFFARKPDGLGAPVFFRSELTGRPSLGVDAMRAYAACADDKLREAALAVLDVRKARKIRSTYVMSPLELLGADKRIHPTWKCCGPVSGRWACADPNLMNLIRAASEPASVRAAGGIRSLYIAREGYLIVAFDASQLEMRIAAYASGDPNMIGACETADLHAGNAKVIFGDAFDAVRYVDLKGRKKSHTPAEHDEFEDLEGLRTLAKSAGFAVCYMANAETVYARIVADGKGDLLPHGIRSVEQMLIKLRRGFSTYFDWQATRLTKAIADGYTDEPITGRRRWLGHDPSPTECANHPIQGGAAGLMNIRLPMVVQALRNVMPSATLVAQVHDSGVFEVHAERADEAADIMREVFEAPITLRSSGASARFPIDIKKGPRWS